MRRVITAPMALRMLILLLVLSVQHVHAQLTQKFMIPNETLGHIFSLSTEAPVTMALRADEALLRRTEPLYRMFEKLTTIVDDRQRNNDTIACNLRKDVSWGQAALRTIEDRQIGRIPDICNSRLDGNVAVQNGELPQGYATTARMLIRDGKNALFAASNHNPFVPDRNDASHNWTRGTFELQGWNLRSGDQQCTLDSMFAYRINDTLYLRAGITNRRVDAFMPDFARQYIDEYIPEETNRGPLRLPHVREFTENTLELSTTLITKFSGKAGLATFSAMQPEDNPALVEALRLNELAVDQANDAITPSNIGILALPMVMSLIPVAFVADLNTWATLWYIIFTDVFSTLPFLIKGIELIQSGSNAREELVAYQVGNGTLGQMEVWVSVCTGDDTFLRVGISFVVLAVAVLIIGIILEFLASRTMRRRRMKLGSGAAGPFGIAAFGSTKFAPLGRVDEGVAEWERRYSDVGEDQIRPNEPVSGGTDSKRELDEIGVDDEEVPQPSTWRWWEFPKRRRRRELHEMVREYEVELGLRQPPVMEAEPDVDVGESGVEDIVGAGVADGDANARGSGKLKR